MNERKIKRSSKISWRLEKEKMRQLEHMEEKEMSENLDRGVVFISSENEIFELNLLGTQIWLLCDGEKTKKDIIGSLIKKYQASEEELSRDIDDFLSEMASLQLITYE